jgi:putative transposase
MTTGDIANHLADIYGSQVSRDLVSKVTDAVVEDMRQWASRPLDPIYAVLLIDAIYVKIREGRLQPARLRRDGDHHRRRPRRPGSVGRTRRRRRGRPGVAGNADGLEEPRRQGCADRLLRLLTCCDGLKGLPVERTAG